MNEMSITVERQQLHDAMTGLSAEVLEAFTKPAALITAEHIRDEAQRRVLRATGETAAGIVLSESRDTAGYVVESDNARMPNLPIWIEFGIKQGKPRSHSALAQPYLFISAQLESAAHERRMMDAVQAAIDSVGLGGG